MTTEERATADESQRPAADPSPEPAVDRSEGSAVPTGTGGTADTIPTATAASTTRSRSMRLPRTTGAFSGLLIVVLGIWGGLIPFVGPYFHYAFGGYHTWHFTTNRLWLDILPGAAAVLGGLMLLVSSRRATGLLAGWLAVAAGIWFAVGPVVSLLWHPAGYPIGRPAGGHARQMLELLGYFHGLGVAIAALAAFAMGRFLSRPKVAEEPFVAAGAAAGETATRRRRSGLFGRRHATT